MDPVNTKKFKVKEELTLTSNKVKIQVVHGYCTHVRLDIYDDARTGGLLCRVGSDSDTQEKARIEKGCRVYIQNTEADQKSRKAKDQAAVQDTTSDAVVCKIKMQSREWIRTGACRYSKEAQSKEPILLFSHQISRRHTPFLKTGCTGAPHLHKLRGSKVS